MEDDQQGLIAALFAMLTGCIEDLAAVAVEGQRRRPPAEAARLADTILAATDEIAILARAARVLATFPTPLTPE